MKNLLTVGAAALAILAGPAKADPSAHARDYARMGTYIAVEDMETTTAFYETLFGYPPMISLEKFVAFDVAGGTFAIASKAKYAPDAQVGSGSVPYIQVTDLETLRDTFSDRLNRDLPEIIEEPGINLLKLADPEGQLIEFFELAQN